jgi:hypothetical protein
MTSEIKVDTISEQTSANGVSIDGLTIKDGGITATTGAIVFNEDSADIDTRFESNTYTNILTIDAGDDNVTLGVNNIYKNWYDATNTYEPLFQQTGSSFALASQSQVYQNGANTEGPIKYFGKSRSAAGAVGYTAVADGDILGIVSFQGADGTHFMEGASIRSLVDGTPGVNDVPTNLQFFTNEGTSGASKRWTIETDGNLTPANTAYGIHLGVTTATASNLLDDYEEGVVTNVALSPGSSGSINLQTNFRALAYTKIGRQVTITGMLKITSVSSPTGAPTFALPFALASLTDTAEICRGHGYVVNAANAENGDGGLIIDVQTAGSTTATIMKTDNTVNGLRDFDSTFATSQAEINFSFSYFTS